MNVSSKITQKLAALVILTAGVYMSSEFNDASFVKAASENTDAAQVGKAAPDFSLQDTNGKTQKLSAYKGKLVVLEWLNHGCPFVKKHYSSGNMQALQKDAAKDGVVWLSIVSSAAGKQGYQTNAEHNAAMKTQGAAPAAILIDADGKVGHLYGAKTTPHMFVVNKKGDLAYAGAIDDKPGTDVEEIKTAKNYVKAALDQLKNGKPVEVSSTKSYGCSVKYQQ
jgi:peroxiredoxin